MVLDTLKLARRLAAAGMPTEQADGVAAAIADGEAEQAATKADLAEVRTEIAEVRTEIAEFRTSVIQWIVGAVLLNWAAMAGLVIAIWNLAPVSRVGRAL